MAPSKLRCNISQHCRVRYQGRPREVRHVPEVRLPSYVRQVRLPVRGDSFRQLHRGQTLQPGHPDRATISRVRKTGCCHEIM